MAPLYLASFLVRRIGVVAALVQLSDYPVQQLSVILCLSTATMIVLAAKSILFSKDQTALQLFNELNIWTLTCLTVPFS